MQSTTNGTTTTTPAAYSEREPDMLLAGLGIVIAGVSTIAGAWLLVGHLCRRCREKRAAVSIAGAGGGV